MRAVRAQLGMTELQFARLIGYTGTDRNDDMRIREYERGKKQIPLYIARLVWLVGVVMSEAEEMPPEMLSACLNDDGSAIDWPDWSGYEYEHNPDATYQTFRRGA